MYLTGITIGKPWFLLNCTKDTGNQLKVLLRYFPILKGYIHLTSNSNCHLKLINSDKDFSLISMIEP